ncbi:MAG: hypothetical protein E6J90_27310 [Deltaproteobacteria bacterium]|nr:MAG: hypothetical protein E6J90_27310 [Deltaproteobacteria bacterium]
MPETHLECWTIYCSPRDYPGQFVARKFLATAPAPTATSDVFVAESLEEVRALLPRGLVRFARSELDDSRIVETWL